MARDGHMDQTLQTGLPAGEYCDLISECAQRIRVDGGGMAHIVINNPDEPVVAFIVGGTGAGTVSGSESTAVPSTNTGAPGIPAITTPPTTGDLGWSRTVILIERQTSAGQDLFLRGGLDYGRHPECKASSSFPNPCTIPIRDRQWGSGPHFDKYTAWSGNDHYLDWGGAEPNQGTYQGIVAQGTPAVWTTNDPSSPGHSHFNHYGQHYWLVDVDMDCRKTDNGWFEIKAIVNGQWEGNIVAGMCTGSGVEAPPAQTGNHWARCGMLNVYHFNSANCEITNII